MTLADIKTKLEQAGYSGLYVPGECGCKLTDPTLCSLATDDDTSLIKGCTPGYVHQDPRPGHATNWTVDGSKDPMTAEDFDDLD